MLGWSSGGIAHCRKKTKGGSAGVECVVVLSETKTLSFDLSLSSHLFVVMVLAIRD